MQFSRSPRAAWIASIGGASLLMLALPIVAQPEVTTTTTTTTSSAPLRAGSSSGRSIVRQLKGASPTRNVPVREKLTATQRAAEARRIAKMTPAQRKQMVQKKYDIAPRGWLASYLPADRYKFGKAWQYVSTETDKYYYRPQDMARKRFNANRVIGFRTWQLAMLAGYTPDPATKPAPGAQIVALSQYTTGPNFYRFVEYTYSGQVSPSQFVASYNYARKVTSALRASKEGRKYLGNTLDRVFQAIVEGNPGLIPRTVGGPPPAPATQGGEFGGPGMTGVPGGPPAFPGNVGAPGGDPGDGGDMGGGMAGGNMRGGSPTQPLSPTGRARSVGNAAPTFNDIP